MPFEVTDNFNNKTLSAMYETIQLENDSNTKTYNVEDAIKKLNCR